MLFIGIAAPNALASSEQEVSRVTIYGVTLIPDMESSVFKNGPTASKKMTIRVSDSANTAGQEYTIQPYNRYFEIDSDWQLAYVEVEGETSGQRQPNETFLLTNNGGTIIYYFQPTSWKLYTITYDANGGTGAPFAQYVSAENGSESFTLSSTQPKRSSYSFAGWSTDQTTSEATYTAGETITVSENMTLYAVWTKNSNKPQETEQPTSTPTQTPTSTPTQTPTSTAYPTQTPPTDDSGNANGGAWVIGAMILSGGLATLIGLLCRWIRSLHC
jgi:uncharacterized repeat protein (TIGR02543 family)